MNLGRHSEGDVILAEAGVSRKHARVLEEVAGWFVEDLGSANGTKVNGKKISGKHRLEAGDSISLGPVSFEFQPVMATRIVAPLAAPVAEQTRMIDPSTLARRAEAKKGDDESTRFGGEGPDESTDPNGARPPSVVVDAGPEPVQATSLDVRALPVAERGRPRRSSRRSRRRRTSRSGSRPSSRSARARTSPARRSARRGRSRRARRPRRSPRSPPRTRRGCGGSSATRSAARSASSGRSSRAGRSGSRAPPSRSPGSACSAPW